MAAAALAAGEPRQARAVLDALDASLQSLPPESAAVTETLRDAARALELDHRPGGWSNSRRDTRLLMESALITTRGGQALDKAPTGLPWLLTFVAGIVLPAVLSVQCSLGAAADADVHPLGTQPDDLSLDLVRVVEERLLDDRFTRREADHPLFASVSAALRLLTADLWRWAGAPDQAVERYQAALGAAPAGDLAFHGWAAMVSGDWALGLQGGVEQRRPAEDLPVTADLGSADRLWTRSARLYRRARCRRGVAAALLRRAHAARLRGAAADRSGFLHEAETLAAEAGDGALHALVQVHSWLDRIEDGTDVPDTVCEAVREWGATVGNAGWLQGLSALVSAQATRWSSAGDAPRAAQAQHVADALVGKPAAGAARHSAEGARHQLSAAVLAEEELARCEAALAQAREQDRDGDRHRIAYSDARMAGLGFTNAAVALADPDLLALAADRSERLLEAAPQRAQPRPPAGPSAEDEAEQPAFDEGAVASPDGARAYAAYCRARAATMAGLDERAQMFAQEALDRALGCGDSMTIVSTLVLLRRMDEARELVDWLEASKALDPWLLTSLRLLLGQAPEAARAAPGLDAFAQAVEDRPWELPRLKAEVAASNGDHSTALGLGEEALAHYESHRARLARDVLRSSVASDAAVMSLYHTALLSHLALDGVTREGTGARAGGPGARAAFALAERVRSGFLDSVLALDVARGPAEQRAVRSWLRADSRWSAVYEDQVARLRQRGSAGPADAAAVVAPSPGAANLRERAERELAEAERAVRQVAPAALTAWRGADRVTAEAVAAALPPGVLLLQYHLFGEDLVAWAVTRDRLRVVRTRQWAVAGQGLARRFHSWCSGLGGARSAGADLAELLLAPFAGELRDYQRVLLAPPPALFLVPFQALPWDGGVLGDRRTLSYLPAASVLTRRPPGLATSVAWNALLVADPATDPAAQMAPVPGTAVEVHHAAALLPGADELTGPRATLDAVTRAAAGRGILHLATHGTVDELSPNRNHLVLAGRDRLSVGDLYGLSTDAGPELLVFSGCHTGRGTASGGDVLGLARSALVAGARHAVVSLWPVDDISGCLTMIRMYRHLAAARPRLPDGPGPGVAQALAEAQREVRAMTAAERNAEYAALAAEADRPQPAGDGRGTVRDSGPARRLPPEHPFHWSPFIHIGTQEAMA
ncbi:CHAT domain-containing protein [Streptomyces sp. NPDC001816]|uniref:CHAT domain-containing protein n=1 Tax=Streptomyces sp. NPDC001816 TaxID=3364612 RepID=UPI003691B7A9